MQDAGVDLTAVDNQGQNLLHHSARHRSWTHGFLTHGFLRHCVQCLHIDLEECDYSGQSAWDYTISGFNHSEDGWEKGYWEDQKIIIERFKARRGGKCKCELGWEAMPKIVEDEEDDEDETSSSSNPKEIDLTAENAVP